MMLRAGPPEGRGSTPGRGARGGLRPSPAIPRREAPGAGPGCPPGAVGEPLNPGPGCGSRSAPSPPPLPFVSRMPCLSGEPGPAFQWVQLGVDVGQKPVEGPAAQPPLQLLTLHAVRLPSLGRGRHRRQPGESGFRSQLTPGRGRGSGRRPRDADRTRHCEPRPTPNIFTCPAIGTVLSGRGPVENALFVDI